MDRTRSALDALIKEAASRRGVPEAEILREGIKLAALGARVWDKPLVDESDTFAFDEASAPEDIAETTARAAARKVDRIEANR